RWFADWRSPVPELLGATEPTDLIQQPAEELRPLPRRFGFPAGAGGVLLLGDAAHTASPTLTQGACLALEDAATLGSLVRAAGLPAASHRLSWVLDEYTAARCARAARMARMARRLGTMLEAQIRVGVRTRDALLGRVSPQLLARA